MSEQNTENGRLERSRFLSGKLGSTRRVIAADVTLVDGDPFVHFLDSGLTGRSVFLPVLSSGDDWRIIANVGATTNLTVRYSTGTSIQVLSPGQSAIFFGSSNEWAVINGRFSYDVFGPAGVGHAIGLVPDPGAVAGLLRFLCDDGSWKSVTTAGIVDAYKQVSDGTNTAVASGLSQLRLRSSSGAVVATVTDNDATFGDVVNFTLAEGFIDHDLLLHYVANKHIDHTTVSITPSEGIQGGGSIAASRTLKLDFSGLGTATPALSDTVAYFQTATHFKTTWTTINGILNHNSLLNYVADQHVAHSGVSMIAGTGLNGGGTIAASRTFNLDFTSGFTTVTSMAAGDLIPFNHLSGTMENITFANFNTALDHNVLANFVANKHIDHTTVSITGTGALTGGGDISASRTLDVATNGVANTQFRQGVARSVVGVTGNVTANVADIQGTTDQVLRVNGAGTGLGFGAIDLSKAAAATGVLQAASFPAMTGDVTSVAGALATTIAANAVTNAKAAQMATVTIKSNLTGGTANAADNTLTAILDAIIGSTRGQMLVRKTSSWLALALGSNTQVLTSDGTDVTWAAAPAGSGGGADFKNWIVNGDFEVWQRGAGGAFSLAVAASTPGYTADRWYYTNGANQASVVSQQAGLTTQSRWSARILRNSGQTGTGVLTFEFPLTVDECIALRGQNVTLSFYSSAGANWSPTSGTLSYNLYFGTGTEGRRGGGFTGETNPLTSSVNLTAGAAAAKTTFTGGSSIATNVTQGCLMFSWTPTGTAGAADNLNLDEVQLEIGSSATTFERLPFGHVLRECQRHYCKSFPYATAPAQSAGLNGALYGSSSNSNSFAQGNSIPWRFPVQMRSTPTVTAYNPSAANAQIRQIQSAVDGASTAAQGIGVEGCGIVSTSSSSLVASQAAAVHAQADAGL